MHGSLPNTGIMIKAVGKSVLYAPQRLCAMWAAAAANRCLAPACISSTQPAQPCLLQACALSGWLDYVEWKQRSRLVVGRALAKLRHGMMAAAFIAWLEEVQAAKMEATLATKQGTEVRAKQLRRYPDWLCLCISLSVLVSSEH
jgi:hypothetical protein